MARTSITDFLQAYPFWLTDVAPIEPISLPIFSPLSGFSTITSPEVQIEVRPVEQANWYFPVPVVQSAENNTITMTRGANWWNSDFHHWITTAITGTTGGQSTASSSPVPSALGQAFQRGGPTPRRDLLLIQFLAHSPLSAEATAIASTIANAGLVLTAQGLSSASAGGAAGLAGAAANAVIQGGLAAANVAFGLVEFAPRIPAKAWMLYGCIPTRYKVGSDFDAMSSDVSIQELDINFEYFDEIALSLP